MGTTITGNVPLKLESIYAPPPHPFETLYVTKEIAMAVESEKCQIPIEWYLALFTFSVGGYGERPRN